MVYDSDFYTTRRPYRASPSLSSYTLSSVPSRQIRVLPGLGKVHIVHSYDRIVPYVGHKRLTVVTMPPKVYSTRPSILNREYDRIENKLRPWVAYSATNRYLNSDSAVRRYYVNYPITGVNYTSYYRPSYSYYPKSYSWYYNYPSDYYSLAPYYSSLRSYYSNYWPIYRSLDTYDWPRNYNYYWSIYRNLRPYLRSLDYDFSDLENKIDNLRKMIYLRNPISGYDWSFWPDAQFFYNYKIYRPLSFHTDWPITSREFYPGYWPTYRSYRHYLVDLPSERSFRELRVKNQLYF